MKMRKTIALSIALILCVSALVWGAMRGGSPTAQTQGDATQIPNQRPQTEQRKAEPAPSKQEGANAEKTSPQPLPASEEPSASNDDAEGEQEERESTKTHVEAQPGGEQDAPMERAVSQLPKVTIPDDAEYVPEVVLLNTAEPSTAEDVAKRIAECNVQSVDKDSVVRVTDTCFELRLAQGSSVEDAVNELRSTGAAYSAQPNYVYHLADDESSQGKAVPPAQGDSAASEETPTPDVDFVGPPKDGSKEDLGNAPEKGEKEGSKDGDKILLDNGESEGSASEEQLAPQVDDGRDALATQEGAGPEGQAAGGDDVPALVQSIQSYTRVNVNDPMAPYQWALDSMDVREAWGFMQTKPLAQSNVAVLDKCFDPDHEDLSSSSWLGCYDAVNNIENVPDAVREYASQVYDYHGAHVAGIIGAQANNSKGIAGVASQPGKTKVYPVKVASEDGKAYTTSLVRAFSKVRSIASSNNLRIINFSMGSISNYFNWRQHSSDDAVVAQIDGAYSEGILTVCAAGNQTSGVTLPAYIYPGDTPSAVSVMNLAANYSTVTNSSFDNIRNSSNTSREAYLYTAALPKSVYRYYKSNYNQPGERTKDIAAPGNTILSLIPGSYYCHSSGTSMAAPQVAGVLALMLAVNPNLTASQACDALYLSARDLSVQGWDEEYGYGEVNALGAVKAAAGPIVEGPKYIKAGGASVRYSIPDGSAAAGTFESSDSSVLSISSTGWAYPGRSGVATISVHAGDTSVGKEIYVLKPIEGDSQVPQGSWTYMSIDQDPSVGYLGWTWTSSDKSVATVDGYGWAYGKQPGTVRIRATLNADPSVYFDHYLTVSSSGTVLVDEPTIHSFTYDGREHSCITFDGYENYTILSGSLAQRNAGSYSVTLQPNAGCEWSSGYDRSGSRTFAWSISKARLTATYAGGTIMAGNNPPTTVNVTGFVGGESASTALGYVAPTVSVSTAQRNTAGRYSIKPNGGAAANYTFSYAAGTLVVNAKPSVAGASVSGIGTQAYTGKAVCPRPAVKVGGRTLRLGTDYTLSYRNNVRAGTATVVVTGRGSYVGSKTATFRIVAPSVSYRTHVQNDGWQGWRANGRMSGTSGRGLRLEGINIKLGSLPASGGIQYRTHVQNIGWQGWRSNGAMSGTSGRGLRLEAIEIRLTGRMAQLYDVYYRVHAQNVGWMGWAKNGTRSGTAGFGWRLEGIQVVLVPKGQPAPAATYLGIRQANWRPFRQR